MQNVLFVTNLRSQDSIAVKEGYLTLRPQADQAHYLNIACNPDEIISDAAYRTDIQKPIVEWLQDNSGSGICYIVMSMGIPSRIVGEQTSVSVRLADSFNSLGLSSGKAYGLGVLKPFTLNEFPGTTALVTYMNMGSREATLAYLRKINTVYSAMEQPHAIVSASTTPYAGMRYYFDDNSQKYEVPVCRNSASALLAINPNVGYVYRLSSHVYKATDVSGYYSWGANGKLGADYSINSLVAFSGRSSWYYIATVESGNGQQINLNQGNFVKFFSANAFGGKNYANTPAGMSGYVEEPNLQGMSDSKLFAMWEHGFVLADLAWANRNTPFFIVVGDPLIRK